MKKTLIALMALAGVASATEYTDEFFNEWYQEVVISTGYTQGMDYSLSLTLGEYDKSCHSGGVGYHSGILLDLSTGESANSTWGIFTQAGQYLAFDDNGTNDRPGLTTVEGTSYASSNTSTATGTVNQGTEGWFYSLGGANKQVGVTITVSRTDGVDSVVINKGDLNIANFTIAGTDALNAAEYTLNRFGVTDAIFVANGHGMLIPEPATATLSLLALAGLAARRRRR